MVELTVEVDMHIHGEEDHEQDVGDEVGVIDVLEEGVPPHAEKAGHQLMCQKLFTLVADLEEGERERRMEGRGEGEKRRGRDRGREGGERGRREREGERRESKLA